MTQFQVFARFSMISCAYIILFDVKKRHVSKIILDIAFHCSIMYHMKAILEFDLPEDEMDLERANRALGMALVLWDMQCWFRSQLKYGDHPPEYDQALESARDELCGIMESHGVDLDRMIE